MEKNILNMTFTLPSLNYSRLRFVHDYWRNDWLCWFQWYN